MTNEQKQRQLERADRLTHDAVHALRGASKQIRGLHSQAALSELVTARESVEMAEQSVVAHMRSFGSSWQEIGDALGVTRQAAWARYASGLHQ